METKMNTPLTDALVAKQEREMISGADRNGDPYQEFYDHARKLESDRAVLRSALEAVLSAGRGTSGRIILDADQEASARAALEATK
jgi:hypothetical protein